MYCTKNALQLHLIDGTVTVAKNGPFREVKEQFMIHITYQKKWIAVVVERGIVLYRFIVKADSEIIPTCFTTL